MGVCFIYRDELARAAYKNEENLMLSDFYADAALKLYSDIVSELSPLVEFTGNYDGIDPVGIPSNHSLYVKSFN